MEHFLSNLSQGNLKSMTTGNDCVTTKVLGKNVISPTNILELKPGQSFMGEIIAVNGEEVQLLLDQNQYLTARLEGQIQLALGQNLLFQVQSNKDAKIILKPIYESAFQLHVNESALKSANLPINDKNMQLVSAMIENGLPIDKGTLTIFYRQILQNPQISITNLVKMNKLQIPLTLENVRQFESYQNFQNSLSEAIDEVAQDITRIYDTLSSESTVAEKFINGLLTFLQENEKNHLAISQSPDMEIKPMNPQEIKKQSVDIEFDNDNNLIKQEDYIKNESIVLKLSENEVQQNSQSVDFGKMEEAIVKLLKNKTGAAESTSQNLFDNSNNDSTFNIYAKDMNSIINMLKELSTDEKKTIFTSQLFKEFLKENLKDLWTLSPNEVAYPDKIQELYERIARQSKKIAQIVAENTIEGQTQSKAINNLQENIEFINQINHTFQYVQLPLKFSNQNANGELFVYANKRNLAQNSENLSAILHLDLEYLGKIDVKIQLHTKKNYVTTSFYIDSNMIPFVEQHLSELDKQLEALGFRTKTSVLEREESKTVIEEMEGLSLGASAPMSYQAFDMRT